MELLQGAIADKTHDVPIGLRWKMIHLGTQGKVKPEDQIWVLCLFINNMGMIMAKPLLSELYPSKPGKNHTFPFTTQLKLILEVDAHQKGCKNLEKIWACWNPG